MADIGKWEKATLELPQEIQAAAAVINDVASLLINALSIAQSVLNLVKGFTFGYIDPIQALLDLAINEIKALIKDISEIGIYTAGDSGVARIPFDELAGGFQVYERRMIGRLTDKTDPTLPKLTPATKVLGLFFYAAVGINDVNEVLDLVQSLQQMFNQKTSDQKTLSVPHNLRATYGTEGMNIFDFKDMADYFDAEVDSNPSKAHVTWNLSATSNKDPAIPFAPSVPSGFIVEVSTVKDGLKVYFERPQSNAVLVDEGGGMVQKREHGVVLDDKGRPLVIYGGHDQILMEESLGFNANLDGSGNMKLGSSRVYAKKSDADTEIIPLDMLRPGKEFLFQRTFFVDQLSNFFSPTDGFSTTLDEDDLPLDATYVIEDGRIGVSDVSKPTTYYVRVRSASKKITSEADFQYSFEQKTFQTAGRAVTALCPWQVKLGADVSEPAQPVKVSFPSEETKKYLDRITVALVILALSRSDLSVGAGTEGEDDQSTAKTATGLESMRSLIVRIYSDFKTKFKEKEVKAEAFRSDLLYRCKQVATELYNSIGSMPAVEKSLNSRTPKLLTWKWTDSTNEQFQAALDYNRYQNLSKDMTILDSLDVTDTDTGGKFSDGLGLNPFCVGVAPQIVERDFFFEAKGIMGPREPGFFERKVKIDSIPEIMEEDAASLFLEIHPQFHDFLATTRKVEKDAKGKDVVVYRVPDAFRAMVEQSKQTLGSADNSPVLYLSSGRLATGVLEGQVFFCRNLIDSELYREAAMILNVAGAALKRPSADGQWTSIRVTAALPDLKAFLDQINGWLNTIKQGTKAVTDALQRYIEFVEARIAELQQLIRRINSFLQSIIAIKIPEADVLAVLSDGTDGVLADFVGASDKPSDNALTTYGGGFVLLAGGAPSFLIDLLVSGTGGGNP